MNKKMFLMAAIAVAGQAFAQAVPVTLSGDQEVPAVKTSASGSGKINVGSDMSVSGSVTTTGVAATMAHIHQAPAGQSGPVIIPLAKSGEGIWAVPPGAKLSDAQYQAFKAGGLYVNVHSAEHPDGEIRGQLRP